MRGIKLERTKNNQRKKNYSVEASSARVPKIRKKLRHTLQPDRWPFTKHDIDQFEVFGGLSDQNIYFMTYELG